MNETKLGLNDILALDRTRPAYCDNPRADNLKREDRATAH